MDLPLVSGSYTWSNNRESSSWSKIDKFLVSPAWETQFPGLSQRRLPRLCSDHVPNLHERCDFHRSSRYFKFENMWLKSEGFVNRVK